MKKDKEYYAELVAYLALRYYKQEIERVIFLTKITDYNVEEIQYIDQMAKEAVENEEFRALVVEKGNEMEQAALDKFRMKVIH
jgi:hypothetical protein